jgi:hydrogenase expression/formation protein HypC
MCLAYPGKIIKINADKAVLDIKGFQKEVNISLVEVELGDFVMVHAGFAIERMTKEEALEALKLVNF